MSVTTEVIRREDGYGIFAHRHEAPSTTLVITFGDIFSRMAMTGFATDWCLKRGHDTVYVAQKKRSQYQFLSRDEFAEAIAPITTAYDRVVCYGSSVGGYCAFYFGGTIRSEIVAAAPRLPRHPICNAPRFRDIPFNHQPVLPKPAFQSVPRVIIDPLNLVDVRFLYQYAGPQYPKMKVSPVPKGGHKVLATLRNAGLLSSVMPGLIDGKTDVLPKWAGKAVREYLGRDQSSNDGDDDSDP